MNILGLGVFVDSSASIINNGKIICAVEEERLNRIKHYNGIPWLAVDECLDIAGIGFDQIKNIALGWNPYKGWINRIGYSLISAKSGYEDLKTKAIRGSGYIKRCKEIFSLKSELKKRYGINNHKVYYVNHHLSHAASAYFASPYNKCNIIVADGVGESETISFYQASYNKINRLKSFYFPNSLGHLYASITGFLGYKMTCDEGKIMAMAGFGEDEYKSLFDELIEINPKSGKIKLNHGIIDYHLARNGVFKKKFVEKIGIEPRKKDEPLTKRHFNLACSLQNSIEKAVLSLLKTHLPLGHGKPLCSSGGLFLNSVLNGKIVKEFSDNYFIFPACGDNGVSVGAAYYLDSIKNKKFEKHPIQNAYFGKEHKVNINNLDGLNGLRIINSENIYEDAAKLINTGNIVGWYSGKMEFGPRALGNRSILASPLIDGIKDKVNSKVKHRENYRPFACALLEDEMNKYFNCSKESPYMLKVFKFNYEYKSLFPSINHVDNSCRVQTVTNENNPHFYKLLTKIKATTGYGIVLNTSMNDAGEPIVNSPQEAVNLLLKTDLDCLILDNYILKK